MYKSLELDLEIDKYTTFALPKMYKDLSNVVGIICYEPFAMDKCNEAQTGNGMFGRFEEMYIS